MNSETLPLFAIPETGRSRRSDPETSKAAARSVRVGTLKWLIMESLRAHRAGLTSEELTAATKRSLVSISPRLRPMEQENLIEQAGVRENSSGHLAIVWRVTGN